MTTKTFFLHMASWLAAALLTAACTDEPGLGGTAQQPLPEGYGRLQLTIATPEDVLTRAVDTTNPWLEGSDDERAIKSYYLLICNGTSVQQVVRGGTTALDAHDATNHRYPTHDYVQSQPIAPGTYNYTFYCLANFTTAMLTQIGLAVDASGNITSTALPTGFEDKTLRLANISLPDEGMPMTGKLSAPGIEIKAGEAVTIADPLVLWRMLAKLEFKFENESGSKVKVKGIEVEPINQASTAGPGIYVFSKDELTSVANLAAGSSGITLPSGATADVGSVKYEPATALELAAKNAGTTDEGTLFFYVNETDGTFTTTNNQFSIRVKIARQKTESEWYDDELRYGVTTHYGDGTAGQNGFNVIRRNDWIHIPIHLTDWQLRVEPLAFVPIGGYPATMLSSDALTATFSTGGMIALQPFIKKYTDSTWRDFDDTEVTLVSISWKNSDGTDVSGTGKIVKTAFAYDPVNKCIIGELNNSLASGTHQTTITLNVKLGPTGSQYDYSFTFNVVLQK